MDYKSVSLSKQTATSCTAHHFFRVRFSRPAEFSGEEVPTLAESNLQRSNNSQTKSSVDVVYAIGNFLLAGSQSSIATNWGKRTILFDKSQSEFATNTWGERRANALNTS